MNAITIKELLKKSPFISRLARKYAVRHGQPDWGKLVERDESFWKSTLAASRRGNKKILMATSVGSHLAGTMLESALSAALTLRGADVEALLCDSALPACLACWHERYPDHRKFVRNGPTGDCKICFGSADKMYRSLGFRVHRYSDYLSAGEIRMAEEMSRSVAAGEIWNFRFEGMAVGEHAMAGALRFFARGTIEGEPYGESILRRYLQAALLTAICTNNLLGNSSFSTAVFHHGIYVPQGLIGEACRRRGVHVVNWNPAYRKGCFIFSHHDTYHHTMMTEPVENWRQISLDNEREAELMEYLKSRWKGKMDWIWFHERPTFELADISSRTGVDFSKPCIGMLTSVMWDAVLHYPSNVFPNMIEWVKSTIEYFIGRPELQLVIRIHPAELRGTLPSRQRIADAIRYFFPELPSNIIVIPPESDVSTYAIMGQCDSVIVYNTKTGVELTAIGIPVIVAGEAWIRNKGFAIDANSVEGYLGILDGLPLGSRMSEEDTLMAKKYAYHFFFRRMIPLECMEPTGMNPPFRVRLSDFGELSHGRSKGLDLICEGILDGRDFVFPAERKDGGGR